MKSLALAALLAGVAPSWALAQQPVDVTSSAFRAKVSAESWYRLGEQIQQLAEEHVRVSAAINAWVDDLRAENSALRQRCGPPCSDIGKADAR